MHTHTLELGTIQVVVSYDSTRFDDRRLSLPFDCSSFDDLRYDRMTLYKLVFIHRVYGSLWR